MKILHFLLGRCNPNSANGVDKAAYYLSKAQAEKGHTVYLFSLTYKSLIPIPGVNVQNFKSPKFPFRLPSRLFEEISKVSPDLVHLHSVFIPQNIIVSRWLISRKIPYIITPHGGLTRSALKKSRFVKLLFHKLFERNFWNNALYIHAIGESESNCILDYGIKKPVVIAPHAIDPREIPDRELLDKKYLEKNYPVTKNKRVFLFLGRLDMSTKGLDILLESFAKLRESLKNNMLILTGPDWRGKRTSLEKLIKDLGLQDNVIVTGPKFGIEKFNLIHSADIFVHPSRHEAAIPFSVLEALSIGKPCLITTSISFKNFFENKDICRQVDTSIKGILEGLEYFSTCSKEDIIIMGEMARKKIFLEFSWENTVNSLDIAFQKKC
ncbi:MAG: hypothetical protein CV087_21580 [Candidatus Brocadia sp. WS118]|nr:MAG: hypothetical protein CV087_21580 [Candidatus Brocadia sp. WS118]